MKILQQMDGSTIEVIVIVALSFLAIILWGYLWNYFLIKELKRLNGKMQSIEDALRRIARNNTRTTTPTTPTSPTMKVANEELPNWKP